MGRVPYHKFYKRDAAEDKQITCNTLRFEGYAGQQFSTLSGDERQQGGRSSGRWRRIIHVLDKVTGVHYTLSMSSAGNHCKFKKDGSIGISRIEPGLVL